MSNGCISINRIISKLDEYLHKNDYIGAERHLQYWLGEAKTTCNSQIELLILNELMGLYRKLGKQEQALDCVSCAIEKIEQLNIGHQVGAATTFLNCATVYKAFGMADKSMPIFERAREVYEKELEPTDSELGGLYNNMALALVDIKDFERAREFYGKAVDIMKLAKNGEPQLAITYLNMASAAEAELGALDADETVQQLLDKAQILLDDAPLKDGNYAFVCEKCASVFGYFGRFAYEKQLYERARSIYERS